MTTCFICRETGAKTCDGHCGLCPEHDTKPSERQHDGRPFLPGEEG